MCVRLLITFFLLVCLVLPMVNDGAIAGIKYFDPIDFCGFFCTLHRHRTRNGSQSHAFTPNIFDYNMKNECEFKISSKIHNYHRSLPIMFTTYDLQFIGCVFLFFNLNPTNERL